MFNSKFFINNRRNLISNIDSSLVLVAASSLLQYSADLAYPFRQDSNFWYLCGLNQPELVLSINTENGDCCLYLPQQNEYEQQWDGEIDEKELSNISGISDIKSIEKLKVDLTTAKNSGLIISTLMPLDELVMPYGFYSNPARRVLLSKIKEVEQDPVDVRIEIARLRQVKQQLEVDCIQNAINITAKSLVTVKEKYNQDHFDNESQINRLLNAEFFRNGGDGFAFESIVAAGKNAAIIHYRNNNAKIIKNQELLLDVGASYGNYTSDISRTWLNGDGNSTKNNRIKKLHAAVIEVQEYAIGLLKPGTMMKEFQKLVEEKSALEMSKLGIRVKSYPHGVSHFMGIDVHDAGDYARPLVENTILTVEPGIYLKKEGIGIRIEDDIIITKKGAKNMSALIPSGL